LRPLPSLLQDGPPAARLAAQDGVVATMRDDWPDPTDDRPSAARTARTVSGRRAFCPLRWCLKRHQERSSFAPEHVAAADRLRLCYDGARLGFASLKDWRPIQSINYRSAMGPTNTALRQYRCSCEFDAVWTTFDESERVMVRMVVLENLACGKAAQALGWSLPMTVTALVAVLDGLCKRWDIRATRQAA
jgi:hypothetical protein